MPQVNLNTTALDAGNAYLMAKIAKVAYIKHSKKNPAPNESAILNEMQKEQPGFKSVKGFSRKSAQAIVLEHDDYITLAFRGTDEVADWFDNIKFRMQRTSVGKFHGGFLNAVDDLWYEILDYYLQLNAQQGQAVARPLFITGHSLGGAMAVVAAAKLLAQQISFHSVYTFGQPRVAQHEAKDEINALAKDRIFRFVNNSDIVSRVPGPWLGYRHVGKSLYITEENEIYEGTSLWFRLKDFVDGVWSSFKRLRIDLIHDHNMEHYLDSVETWNFK